MRTALALVVTCWASSAWSASYYVDGSCSADGDGLGDGCAAMTGGRGAWLSPQRCLSTAVAGDTCLIKNGTYVTSTNGTDPSENGGFTIEHSGTATAPITVRNYPGHSPLLANCPAGQTVYCPRPTLTAPSRSWVTVQGLRIRGGIWIYGTSPVLGQGNSGVVLDGLEIEGGWGEVDDGNWSGIFLANQQGAHIVATYLHDIVVPSGGGQQSSGSCIKLYQNADTVVERNTCRSVPISNSQAGGIDDKAQATRNVHRYNWIEDINTCVRINNQLHSTGVQVYGNVCIGAPGTVRPGVRLIDDVDGAAIYNNTFVGFARGLEIMSEGSPVTGIRFFNNIVAGSSAGSLEAYQPGLSLSDYNQWPSTNGVFLYGGTWHSTLSAFSAATGLDTHSAAGECGFVAPPGDVHLLSSSSCRGAGRVDGVSSGAAVDRGAYGVTACAGHTCGAVGGTGGGSGGGGAGGGSGGTGGGTGGGSGGTAGGSGGGATSGTGGGGSTSGTGGGSGGGGSTSGTGGGDTGSSGGGHGKGCGDSLGQDGKRLDGEHGCSAAPGGLGLFLLALLLARRRAARRS